MNGTASADHDLLIRIDENVKAIKDHLSVCGETQAAHEERISILEGEMKATAARQSIWSAVAIGLSGAIAAAFKWLK